MMADNRGIDMNDDDTPLMPNNDNKGINRNGRSRSVQQRPVCYCLAAVLRPCLAEAIGVAIFVFIGSLSALSNNIVAIALAHGLTIMTLVAGFGKLSGGHFNPCVTLGVTLGGGVSPLVAIFFVCAQLFGSILGSALVMGVLPDADYTSINGGVPSLGNDVTIFQGILCESTLTFLLLVTVLMTAVDTDDNVLAPMAIGMAVAVDILAGGTISGAVMNPARAFGPTVIASYNSGAHSWAGHYVYWVGPSIGSVLASMFYRIAFGSSRRRLLCPYDP